MNIRGMFSAILEKLGLKEKTLMLNPGNDPREIKDSSTSGPNFEVPNSSAAESFRAQMASTTALSQTPDNDQTIYLKTKPSTQTTVEYADTTGDNTTVLTEATSSRQRYFGPEEASKVKAKVDELLGRVGTQPPRDDGVRS